MKVILFVTIIVLGDLSLATWLYLHLEEHMEWREWHVPRGTEFAPCPLEYGEHDGLLLTDVEYATCKDLLEVRYTVENRNKGQTPVRNDLILAFQNGIGLGTVSPTVLLQCLFDRFGSVFPQCGLMVFPGVVIVSR